MSPRPVKVSRRYCRHRRCQILSRLAPLLALAGVFALLLATDGHRLNVPWLAAAFVLFGAYFIALMWDHPQPEPDPTIEDILESARPCGPCDRGLSLAPCRCTKDCGRPGCSGWYAEYERAMRR